MPRRAVALGVLVSSVVACERAGDTPSPAESAQPQAAAPSVQPSPEAAPRAPHLPDPYRPPPSVLGCCQALQRQAAQGGKRARQLVKAAAVCQAMAARGQSQASITAALGKELAGEAPPEACAGAAAE